MPTVSVGEVVQDYSVYPRSSVNVMHVSNLADALRSGAVLPPIVIDGASKRIIDGFHRTAATLRVHGPDGTIECEVREYATEGDLFLDCVRLNSDHGLTLTPFDRAKIATTATELGLAEDTVAAALHMPSDRLAKLVERKTSFDADGSVIPIKNVAGHLKGVPLTDVQMKGMKRSSGWSARFYCEQLLNILRSDLLDMSDRPTLEKLHQLNLLISERLSEVQD